MKIPVPSEAETQSAILDYLRMRGHYPFRVNTQGVPLHDGKGGIRGFRKAPQRGVSDIVGVRAGGMFFAIEVKKKGKHPTPEQTTFLEEVRRRGGIGFVAYGVDDVIAAGL